MDTARPSTLKELQEASYVQGSSTVFRVVFAERPHDQGQRQLPWLESPHAGCCGVVQNASQERTLGSQISFGWSLSLTMCTILGKLPLLPEVACPISWACGELN